MKVLIILLVFSGLLFSCGSKNEKDTKLSSKGFEISIDTIQVDPGNDILMAGAEIWNPGNSTDDKRFYNWDQHSYKLEVINLDNYKLERKVHFEKDGPKGLGSNYIFRMDVLSDGKFGFEDYESYRIYDVQGQLQKRIKFDAGWISLHLEENERFELHSLNEDGTVLAGMHFEFDTFEPHMLLLDWEKEEFNSTSLPEFEKLKNYRILLRMDGKNMASSSQDVFMQFQGDSIIISNTAFNDVYFYNINTQSLRYQVYKHGLTPNSKQKTYKNETSSEEEFNQLVKEMRGEVEFSSFYFDETKQQYYRFASEVINLEEEEPKWNVFMLIYDKNLNLLGEKELMTFKSEVLPLFIKDGKVHFYLNMEDELGFIRVGITEE